MVNEDVIERVVNEYSDVCNTLTPNVTVRRVSPPPGSLALIEFTVHAKTYYITDGDDIHPKETDQISFYLDIKEGFPKDKPYVYFEPGKQHASINCHKNGYQCIDDWHFDPEHAGRNSTLVGTVKKVLMDIVYDPSVSNYDSMANRALEKWQKEKTKSGEFPTCDLTYLMKFDEPKGTYRPALPVKKAEKKTRPALPKRGG